jgi:rubrerythrin
MTPNLLDELEEVFSPNVDYSTAALRAFNFCRTHAPALADMAKRMEAAERDAAMWRRHISSPHSNHSHFCRRCAFSYTPASNESEDCPSCGFDGVDFGMIDSETRAAIDATQEGEG